MSAFANSYGGNIYIGIEEKREDKISKTE
ncbi:MAG: hypothetical protein GY750_03510 [Lentisphaerae bacterium]|nr:hypothetical protein [Lentisphaerota bacterium]MCP4100485.1 hypothetical protein [Lentisphaerota bacterium]